MRPSGPFRNLGFNAETAPAQPSNEPHTSPVPGYEAVEATGVASVGAIEPASLPHNIRRESRHRTRKGGGGVDGTR